MRGTQNGTTVNVLEVRIIPAYAGNTMARDTPIPLKRDHPRVCGEHVSGRPEGSML